MRAFHYSCYLLHGLICGRLNRWASDCVAPLWGVSDKDTRDMVVGRREINLVSWIRRFSIKPGMYQILPQFFFHCKETFPFHKQEHVLSSWLYSSSWLASVCTQLSTSTDSAAAGVALSLAGDAVSRPLLQPCLAPTAKAGEAGLFKRRFLH